MRGFRHRLSYGPPLRQIVCPTWRYNSDAGKQNGRHGGHEFGVEENSRMVGAPPSVRSPGGKWEHLSSAVPRFLGIAHLHQVRPSILPNRHPSTADRLQKHEPNE